MSRHSHYNVPTASQPNPQLRHHRYDPTQTPPTMKTSTCRLITLILLFAPAIAFADGAAPWSRFHGAGGHGYVAGGNIPATWTDADYAWTRELGSRDISSPILQGDRVFLLVSNPKEQTIAVQCLSAVTGKLLWSKSSPQLPHHLHQRNTLASSTPAADDQFVFVAWSDPDHTFLKCFDHDGNEVWTRDFGSWQSQHGFGTSPAIIGDKVVLHNSQQAEQLEPGQTAGRSRMIAVDRMTGETAWETPLKTTKSCYGVPTIATVDGKQQIIATDTGSGIFSLDPDTGKMLWSTTLFNSRSCSTPIIAGDIAIGTSGSGGGNNQMVAVRIPSGDNAEPKELYRIKRNAPYVPTSVLKNDRLFMVDDRGIAQCIDVQSGDVLWFKRIGGNFGASPIIVGDKMLMISLDGEATTIAASDQFQETWRSRSGWPRRRDASVRRWTIGHPSR